MTDKKYPITGSFEIIACDFDGTLCRNAYPDIGAPNTLLFRQLINQQRLDNKIILWTCRTGEYLEAAVKWCAEKGLIFDAINENLPEIIEIFGNDNRKIFSRYGRGKRRKIMKAEFEKAWYHGDPVKVQNFKTEKGQYTIHLVNYRGDIYFFKRLNGKLVECCNLSNKM